uniref:Uncharacterized protein n=1 Tax=Ciona savignyi TaxID=51511 RepID=H2ZC34_CIOSA
MGTTHCSMNATYLMANKDDLTFNDETPVYQLESVYRDCATAAVTKSCTSSQVGTLSANRVVCQETCQMDGCNTGWPARPRCTQCTSSNVAGYDECQHNSTGGFTMLTTLFRSVLFPGQALPYIYQR